MVQDLSLKTDVCLAKALLMKGQRVCDKKHCSRKAESGGQALVPQTVGLTELLAVRVYGVSSGHADMQRSGRQQPGSRRNARQGIITSSARAG